MKKTHTFFAAILICQLLIVNGNAQQANFSGITNGQTISIDTGIITLTADNNLTGTFNGPGVTDNGNGTAFFTPATAGIGSHSISYHASDTGFVKIAAGTYHSLGIKRDGTLWAWGKNEYGQLGDGNNTDRNAPVQIGTDTNWAQIAGGYIHSLAIKSDGTLWAWGWNNYGQLGDSTNTNTNSPVQIGTANNWSQIAAGGLHSLAIKSNGTLWAWGSNNAGQLGDSSMTDRNSPVQIGTATNWSQISAGYRHSLAIKSGGTLWAWGYNNLGQLGDGTNVHRTSPVQIGNDNNWIKIAAGSAHSLGIKSPGTLWAWGGNNYGQLGDFTTTTRFSPVQIGAAINWSQISAGDYHSIGIKSDGTLLTWGYNASGQLGDGSTSDRHYPWQIGIATNWNQISAGGHHSLAIKSDGSLWVWGFNGWGQLGDGTAINRTSPVLISFPFNATLNKTVFVLNNAIYSGITNEQEICIPSGTITLTASNDTSGAYIGPGVTDNGNGTAIFDPVSAGAGSHNISYEVDVIYFVQISAGYAHSLGIKSDGTLWAWGYNLQGQLGDGTHTTRTSPVQIGTASNWSQIATGGNHSLAIKSDGTLWAWGRNNNGQLGDSTAINRISPVQIGTANNWSEIAAGGGHSLAVKNDGTLWAWGANTYGQLGDGTSIERTSPVQIGAATNWSKIAAGGYFSLGIQGDETIWAWGDNAIGQLGDSTHNTSLSPIQIGTATNWSQISAGSTHSLAIKSNGTLWAWGSNDYGALGDSTTTARAYPAQIGTSSNWSHIDAGRDYCLGIKSDETLWAWGANGGRLGDSTNIIRTSPVQIGAATNWSQISAGDAHSLGIKSDHALTSWGFNHDGQLGLGNNIDRNYPGLVNSPTPVTSTKTITVLTTPVADAPSNVSGCDNYILPGLSVGNYYTAANGGGTMLDEGDTVTTTQTLYVYATNGSCSDENNFDVTISTTPTADAPSNVSACDSYTLPSLSVGNYYTAANAGGTMLNAGANITSTQTLYVFATNGSCNDENNFDVTIHSTPSYIVTIFGNTLTADETGATYQWLDCDNGNTPISGATSQSFTPSVSGNFAVEVTKDGCSTTSACQSFTFVGLDENAPINFSVYPNPTSGEVTMLLGDFVNSEATITVRNSIGQATMIKNYSSGNKLELFIEGETGLYLVEIRTGDKHAAVKVIKN